MWQFFWGASIGDDWVYSPAFQSSLVRIRHIFRPQYARGLICQATFLGTPSLYQIRRLYPKVEADVYQVEPLQAGDIQSIGVKLSYRDDGLFPWVIQVDKWV